MKRDNDKKIMVLLFVVLLTGSTFGQQDPSDQVERSMRYVDRVTEANGLFNQGKTEQALTIYEELDRQDRDLDEDGFVLASKGDCLAELNRIEEARQAYMAAIQLHPELEPRISERLMKLTLAGEVGDDEVSQLRDYVQKRSDGASFLMLSLGLQKRAHAILTDAIAAIKLAGEESAVWNSCSKKMEPLQDVADDLASMIEQSQDHWGFSPKIRKQSQKNEQEKVSLKKQEGEWEVSAGENVRTRVQVKTDGKGEISILAGGKKVSLTQEQKEQIRHRQQQLGQAIYEVVTQGK